MEDFTYLGSTISNNLSLDTELNTRVGKAATTMARLAKKVRDNSLLTTNTQIKVYQACVLSTLLYGSEAWTLYSRQEHRLNLFYLCCLRRILGITWQDRVSNTKVLALTRIPSMFALLSKRRLRWLGHVSRIQDGRIPKDILFGELATGSRSTGRPLLRFKDVCKRDLKAVLGNLETLVEDRVTWRHTINETIRTSKKRREDKMEESKARKRQNKGSVPTDPTKKLMCTTCIPGGPKKRNSRFLRTLL